MSANTPGWEPRLDLCRDCSRRFTSALHYLETHDTGVDPSRLPILPTPVRLGAKEEFRGRGVTIAFLDAGSYAPDLVEPKDRIVKYVDVTDSRRRREDLDRPDHSS